MEPNNKKTLILIVSAALLVAAIVFGVVIKSNKGNGPAGNIETEEVAFVQSYSSEVPSNAKLTEPLIESPVDPKSESTAKIRTFEVKASRSGFDPSEVVVNKGDTVGITVMSVDGDYDFDLPAIGGYQFVGQGEKRQISFQASPSGTFIYRCRDHCPTGGVISGKLIVK